MSVIAPWRKKDSQPERAFSPTSTSTRQQKPKLLWVALILVALATIHLCATLVMAHLQQKIVVCRWEEARFLCANGDRYVVETPLGFQVWSGEGLMYEVTKGPSDTAVLTPRGLAVSDSSSLRLVDDKHEAELMALQPGEKLLRDHNADEVVTVIPSQKGDYGEAWILCTAGLGGNRYRWVVPAVPVMAQSLGTQMFVATVDIETGGCAGLYCFVQGEAQKKWFRTLGFSMWRQLLVNQNCIVAVLDTGVMSYSFDGDLLWSFDSPGKLMSASLSGDAIVLAWAPSSDNLQDVSSYSGILSMSLNGEVLWRRSMPGRFLKVTTVENGFSGAPSGSVISVLSETSVTWIRAEDGRDISSTKTSGSPVYAGNGFILVRKGLGLQLIAGRFPDE